MARIGGPNSNFERRFNQSIKSLNNSIQLRTNRISAILEEAYNEPKPGAKYWNEVRRRLDVQYRALDRLYSTWASKNIPLAYRASVRELMDRLNKSKEVAGKAKKSFSSVVTSRRSATITTTLVKDAITDWRNSLGLGQANLNRLTRRTQQQLVSEAFIDDSVRRAVQTGNLMNNTFVRSINLSDTLAGTLKEVSQVIDGEKYVIAGSRRFKPKYYAEMVSRVKFHEAQAFGAIQTATNYGTSLIQVSNHNTPTEICQQYENKIFSIKGKDKRFPPLATTPPFHVNCLHLLYPVFDTALEVTGDLEQWSEFSKGKTKTPPNKGFIPIEDRGE